MKVMTYNVHSCVGMDRRMSPERIAEVIARFDPDVVALQELDVGRARSGGIDQVRRIAELLRMESHFHPAFRIVEEEYGDAILSRLPTRLIRAGALPEVPRQIIDETRGALWVEVLCAGRPVQVLNTHLGLGRHERREQARALLGPEWIGGALQKGPVVFCGDLNSLPGRRVHSLFCEKLRDAQHSHHGRHRKTFPTRFPLLCLDYILVSETVKARATEVPTDAGTRLASDHFPLLAELEF